MSRLLEEAGGLAFVRQDDGEHSSMGMAHISNEGSEGSPLQSGLVYLAGTGGRESPKNRAFGLFTSVDAPKDIVQVPYRHRRHCPPISLLRAISGGARSL